MITVFFFMLLQLPLPEHQSTEGNIIMKATIPLSKFHDLIGYTQDGHLVNY